MLFDPAGEAYQVSLPVAIGIAGTLALLLGVALARVVKVARRPVAVGTQHMVGHEGVVRRDGQVQVNGELWRARSSDGSDLAVGEHVVVEQVEDDLRLVVGSIPTPTREERPA
jgi:membrane-bound serine protease (ClpP class)